MQYDDLPYVCQLALEWWLANDPKTKQRLEELVRHYADVYGMRPEGVPELVERAWAKIPEAMKERHP
jgi:hypothetical protein